MSLRHAVLGGICDTIHLHNTSANAMTSFISQVAKDGELYEGGWSKDNRHGHGLLQDSTGAEYLGFFLPPFFFGLL